MVDPDTHYDLAAERFGLDRDADRQAAVRLAELLEDEDVVDPEGLRATFEDATVVVLGPVPGGAETIDPAKPTIAAGGAVRQALSAGIQPQLVVTDLDGSDSAHKMFSRVGATTAVHAHGDNVHLLERLVPELEGPMFGTCQTEPPTGTAVEIHRYGGFTDGDRACFIAAALGAAELELAGWNLEEAVSGEADKEAKLAFAERMLDDVPIPLTFVEPEEPDKELDDLDLGDGLGLEFGDGV